MTTTNTCTWLDIDEKSLLPTLAAAREKLNTADGEIVLDFSSFKRIGTGALKAMEALANAADERGIPVALHGVNVELYKVLKLMRLSRRFRIAD